MNILVIGSSGQLACELVKILGPDAVCLGRSDTDITNESILAATLDAISPNVIINASAYTAVDNAEIDQERCFALNCTAVRNLANYCKRRNVFLVHVSTDYVFNGYKGSPYLENDPIEPQGVYGKSKAEGEASLLDILPDSSCLIRTAWVYSSSGNNFVKTMLRLMSQKEQLSVIDDQIGTPTWAKGLATACVYAALNRTKGVFHWTDEGVASWYDFALAIRDIGINKGLLKSRISVKPIPSSQYPTAAKRPHYSVLDKTTTRKSFDTLNFIHWREQLSLMMDELTKQN